MNLYKQKSAEELMEIYQDGSPEDAVLAFEELYRRYSDRVYQYCLKKLSVRVDAEDTLQKVFLKIHESKHLYKTQYGFEQWIFVIAKTTVIDLLRKRLSDAKKIEAFFHENEVSLPLDSDNEIELKDLNQLSAEQRKLLEFKYFDEMTYKEMSLILNKSEISLRKTVSRLINRIKKGGSL